jgi:hypothetical protein
MSSVQEHKRRVNELRQQLADEEEKLARAEMAEAEEERRRVER